MITKTKIRASQRLLAYASPAAKDLIQNVEKILKANQIERDPNSPQYPRRYRKEGTDALVDKMKKEFEKAGFKFVKSALHGINTKAFESDGMYQSVNYILDIAYRDGDLVVDLHY